MILDKVYNKLPVFLQNMVCSLYGWKEKRIRFSRSFFDFLNQYKNMEYWTSEQIIEYKKVNLRNTVVNAFDSVPYYRNLIPRLELTPQVISCLSDLKKLPVLSKEDVRQNQQALLSEKFDLADLQEYHTSGTTGTALTFFKTRNSIAKQWAIWYRHRARFDCDLGDLHVNFTGKKVVPASQSKPPYWRYNAAYNQYLINMPHISKSKIRAIVDFLNTIKPVFYSGYPSIIAEVARLAIDHNLFLKDECKPKYIFCGAENTLDYQKDVLELWTGAIITDQYGLTEGNCNMSRCEHGNYHEDFEFCHIECIDPELLPNGRIRGRLIGTSFSNPAMPLIRYDTGDVAVWAPEGYKCPCGRNSIVIESIEGRIDDSIKLLDGRRVMRFDYIFKGTDSIQEAQVCQYKEGEVVIKIVFRDHYSSQVEDDLKSAFSHWICSETTVIIRQVDSIEKSSSGKFRAVKSYL